VTVESSNPAIAHAQAHAAIGQRPAIWPWLLMPLAVLALYFTLRTVREMPAPGSTDTAAAAQSSASH